MWQYQNTDELYHYGILGMRWGHRRYQNANSSYTSAGKKRYQSTGIRAAIARHQNEKVDNSFKKWKENSQKRADAIELGKKKNLAQRAYENDKSNKDLKNKYKEAKKAYKDAYKGNTTYRKGQIRKEVGSDLSRKYLSEARKVKKEMIKNPNDQSLQKKYNNLMSKHDIERAKARKAPDVAAKRSARKASMKRMMTMSAKAAAGTAVAVGGAYVVNKYLKSHDVRLNGNPVRIKTNTIKAAGEWIRKGKNFMNYIY